AGGEISRADPARSSPEEISKRGSALKFSVGKRSACPTTSLDMANDRPSGFRNPWFLFVLNIIGVVVYELLLKAGASATADPANDWPWIGITALASPLTWMAILVIIVDLMIWLYILKYIPLSVAFPLSRTVDVLVPI